MMGMRVWWALPVWPRIAWHTLCGPNNGLIFSLRRTLRGTRRVLQPFNKNIQQTTTSMLRFSALVACILLYASSFANATSATRAVVNSTIVCNDPYNDCSYQGDGVGVEYICTNGGMI